MGEEMSRPRVRVDYLDAGIVDVFHEIFGTAPNAYKNLGVRDEVGFDAFRSAWHGKAVEPRHRKAIERGWKRWRERLASLAA